MFLERHDWMEEGNCIEVDDPDMFFPPRDKELYTQIAAEAKEFCLGSNVTLPCPVRLTCLWFAIESDEQHGIWGGLSHRERNALVRKWQRLYKDTMTLKEYVFQHNKKRAKNGKQLRPKEVS